MRRLPLSVLFLVAACKQDVPPVPKVPAAPPPVAPAAAPPVTPPAPTPPAPAPLVVPPPPVPVPIPPLPAPEPPAPPPAPAPPTPTPAADADAGAAAATPPRRCEVEMFGKIELPAGERPPGLPMVYVSDGDCLADDAHILEWTRAADQGTFFVESFPFCGATLSLCASFEDPMHSPTMWYGKSKQTWKVEGEGEIYLKDVVVPLAKGPVHRFPERAKSH